MKKNTLHLASLILAAAGASSAMAAALPASASDQAAAPAVNRTVMAYHRAAPAVNRAAIAATEVPVPVRGAASVMVVHPWTGEPLSGIPVSLQRLGAPGDAPPMVARTSDDGIAEFERLDAGAYQAYIDFNNYQTSAVRFRISGGNHAYLTLSFNPDID